MRLGLIGAGAIARHHAKAALACGADVHAICTERGALSPNLPELRAVLPSTASWRVTDNLPSMLTAPDLDALVVCLPWQLTPALLPVLVRSDKPMLIEKPVALKASALEALGAHKPGAYPHVRVGFNRLFYETVTALRGRLVRGDLQYASVRINEHLRHHARTTGVDCIPWLLQYTGVHTISLLPYLFGPMFPPSWVATWPAQGNSEYTCRYAVIETRAGKPVYLTVDADVAMPVGIQCVFANGEHWLLSPLETLRVFDRVEIEPATDTRPSRVFTPRQHARVDVSYSHKPGFLRQMKSFLAKGQGQGPGLYEAWKALQLIESLNEPEDGA